jgi:predicted lipid-binding transport protein (Tim44 family)
MMAALGGTIVDVAERNVRLNQATKSGVATMTIANPENSRKRTAGIWLSGLAGCLIIGGLVTSLLFAKDDVAAFGAIGLALLFVCFRLWMREKRS